MRSTISTVLIKEVADLNPSLRVNLQAGEDVAFLPMAAVDSNRIDAVNTEIRPYQDVRKSYTPFMANDVLVAKITPCFENGKIAQVKPTTPVGFGSTEFHVIRAHERKLDSRYLVHFLRQGRIRQEGERRMTGSAGQRRVPENFLANLKIPLPPLPEQQRIAAILDKADALRTKRRAALAQLDALTQSIFLDMFGDPATNPKGWDVEALGNVADTTSGGTPNRNVDGYYGGGIPWVKSGELHQPIVMSTEESLTERGLAESSAKLMPPGSVLIAMYGATVGAVSVLGIEAATNQAICCIKSSPKLHVTYLVQLLRRLGPSLLAKRVGGAQPNLSQELIRRLRVPVPPLSLQQAFSQKVLMASKWSETQKSSANGLDDLFSSLQHHAFRGEL